MRKKSFGLVVALGLALGCLGGCKEKIKIVDGHETIGQEILINEANFPDEIFRDYIGRTYDKDENGRLSHDETDRPCEFWISNQGIRDLKGIECFGKLVRLDCIGNELIELDLSNNHNLTLLWCQDNQLEKLILPEQCKVNVFSCENNQLTELDLSECYLLELLDCSNNQLTQLEFQRHPYVYRISCTGNPLTTLDLSNCPNMAELEVDEGVTVIGAEGLTQPTTDAE